MKKTMIALTLATVMVLAAFVPLMGMASADDQVTGAEEGYTITDQKYNPRYVPFKVTGAYNSDYYFAVAWNTSNSVTDTMSFCGQMGSLDVDRDFGAYVPIDWLTAGQKAYIMAALDYVNDIYGLKYGSDITLENYGYMVAQLVIWTELMGGDLTFVAVHSVWDIFGDAVQDVRANCEGYYAAKMAAQTPGETYVKNIVSLGSLNQAKIAANSAQLQLFPEFGVFEEKTPRTGDGVLVINKVLGDKVSYGSATGGYHEEAVPNAKGQYKHAEYPHCLDAALTKNKNGNGNWFQFNEWNAKGAAATFDFVSGDKLKLVGEYTIVYDGDGWFTITIGPEDGYVIAEGAALSISNVIAKDVQNANKLKDHPQYAANPIWTSAPGQQQFTNLGGHTFSFYAPWVDVEETVYIFIKTGLGGYENTYGVPMGTTFNFKVTGPSFPNGETVQVPMNGSLKLDRLLAGTYTVEEVEAGWKATYYVNGGSAVTTPSVSVNVADGKTVTVKAVNFPVEEEWVVSVQKTLETYTGGYVNAGEGYEFEVTDGNGDVVGTMTTGADGVATLVVPTAGTYFVGEVSMPDYMSDRYAAANESIAVVAVDRNAEVPVPEEFKNDLIRGTLKVSVTYTATETYNYSGSGAFTGGDDPSVTPVQGNGNNNWMRPNFIDVNAILGGEVFQANLVNDNKLTVVGLYTVSASGDGGLLISLFHAPGVPAIANTDVVFGNANTGKTHSDVNGNNSYAGTGFYRVVGNSTILIPAADVAEFAEDGLNYLFFHGGGLKSGSVTYNVSDNYVTENFAFLARNSADGIVLDFGLNGARSYTLTMDVLPGDYELVCLTTGWTYTCSSGGVVKTVNGPASLNNLVCSVGPGETVEITIVASKKTTFNL